MNKKGSLHGIKNNLTYLYYKSFVRKCKKKSRKESEKNSFHTRKS